MSNPVLDGGEGTRRLAEALRSTRAGPIADKRGVGAVSALFSHLRRVLDQPPLETEDPRTAGRTVACAFLAALGVRIALAWATPVINSDGPIYLAQARSILAGDLAAAVVDHSYAPGTAALIALVARCGVPLGAAGYAVSVLAGALAVFPLWALARAAFSPRTAVAAVLLYAFLPVPARLSASVLTTGLFTFVFCLVLALAVQLHARPRVHTALLTGCAAAFAYAVRADGLVLAPAAFAAASFARDRRPAGRVFLALLVAAPTAAAAWAYARFGHTSEGFTFTNKLGGDGVWRFFDLPSLPSRYLLGLFWEDLAESVFVPFLPFLAAGLLVRARSGDAVVRRALLVVLVIWSVGLLKYTDASGIMSKRYVAPLAVLLLPWTAHGVLAAVAAVARAARGGEGATAVASAVAVCLLCLGCVPKLVRTSGTSRRVEKTAGLWVRGLVPPGQPILCGGTYVSFYAETPTAPKWIARLPVERAFAELRRRGVSLIVRDRGLEDYAPGFIRALEKRQLPELARFRGERSDDVVVYRLPAPGPSAHRSARAPDREER